MEYQIGEFSRITRLSIKTLRYYHEEGLLAPSFVDQDSGSRYYNDKSRARARMIRELRALDFSIKDIKEIVQNCEDDSDMYNYFVNKSREISGRIESYRRIEERLTSMIRLEEEVFMLNKSQEIQIKQVGEQLIASIRFKGIYSDTGKKFGLLFKECGRFVCGRPFSMYYDEGYKEQDADIEACVPVSKSASGGDAAYRKLAPARVVSIIHVGSYETIGEAYEKIYNYAKKNNLSYAGPAREIYVKGPGMFFAGNPKKYITEIQFPIH
jgi:DNA-binding transcriptional MerR regulator